MRRAVATTLVLLIVGACSSEAPAGGAAGRRSDATSAEAPAVRLTADLAPRLLLAGVAVPVPFSLLAAGIRCADDDDDGGAGHSPIPHLPPAAQPDLVRARQKDDYYRKVQRAFSLLLLKLENEIP